MNKIVAAFDGLRFSDTTLHQAISLSKDKQAHLVGVFLHEFYQPGYLFAENIMLESVNGREVVQAIKKEDDKTYRDAVTRFTDACSEAGLEYSVHCKKETALKDLVCETLFADVLIVDPRDTFSSVEMTAPGWFIHALLKETHCPVLAVGKKPGLLRKPIFLYDGHPSSIYAMKIFTYLFPSFKEQEVEIITIRPDTLNSHLPYHDLIHEWVKRHYRKTRFRTQTGPVSQLIPLLQEKEKDDVIVTGAYDRSRLSMFLHPSLADDLIASLKGPIFIAHP